GTGCRRRAGAWQESPPRRWRRPAPRASRRWHGRTSIRSAAGWRRTEMHLSRPLEMSLALALREARARRHEFLTVEHVLYALLHDEAVAEVVRACGGDVELLKQELATYLDERLERLPPDADAIPERTLGFQRILQRAAAHVQSSGKEELDGRHVLVAIFRETDSHA